MVAKVKIVSVDAPARNASGVPLAKVGDDVRVTVQVTDRSKSRGGSFKLVHPAFGGAGVSCPFQGRYDTGDSKRFARKRKDRPDGYEGADQFQYTVRVTHAAASQDVQVTAEADCQADPSGNAPLHAMASQTDIDLELPATLVETRSVRLRVARGGNSGIASTALNRFQQQVRINIKLMFLDPEGVERAFPEGLPVRAIMGDRDAMRIDSALAADGILTVSAIGSADALKHRHLTLQLGDDSDKVVLCELPGGTAAQTWAVLPPPTDATGTLPNRFFTLPSKLTLREVDCEVTADDGRWDGPKGQVALSKDGAPAHLGTPTAPMKLVIKPKWQHLRFEYFDRWYGHSDHGDANVTMPAVTLRAFVAQPTSPTAAPEVRSNWWVDPSSDGKVVICVPWFRQKTWNGTALARPNASSELRFELPARTCMKSVSATVRTRVVATTEELTPGPDRLRFYDLPTRWHARNYYAALSTTTGEFGWFQDVVRKPTTLTKPLVFCLDDVVLTDATAKMIADWTHDDRLAIYAHTFDDSLADCTKEGVYKPDTAGNQPWLTEKPASGAPEASENYVRALPRWTRLIIAGGNVFDVFDKRSVEGSTLGDDETVGARAAVRWIDTSKALPPMTVYQKNSSDQWTLEADGRPSAGKWLRGAKPARSDNGATSIQPFYDQEYVTRQGVFNPATTNSTIGRCDLVLLRCCGVADASSVGAEKERAVCLYLLKQHLRFVDAPAVGDDEFKKTAHRALLDAWNGVAPAVGRPTLTPTNTTKRLTVTVLTTHFFMDSVEGAHFTLDVKAGLQARNYRSGQTGGGMLADGKHVVRPDPYGFTNAHEHGHERGLPDEYNETADCASYWQMSFGQHLPGDPYYLCGASQARTAPKPMMNGNGALHGRYFWPATEWVQRAVGFTLKMSFNGISDFRVPAHTSPKRNHAFWPLIGHNDRTLPALTPIASNRARFHGFLYPLGKDHYSLNDLPALEDPVGGTPYDGILILPVLLKVKPPVGDKSSLEKLAAALANAPRRSGGRKLNHRWYLTGSADSTGGETWTFARCLVHFSPRLLIAAADLPTRADFLGQENGFFATDPTALAFATRLDTYHAVPWTPLPSKQSAINAVRVAVPEPPLNVRDNWNTASAAIVAPPPGDTDENAPPPPPPPPPRPGEFAAIDNLLTQYEGIAADQFDNRIAALANIIRAARQYVPDPNGGAYRAAALALDDRAFRKYRTLKVLRAIAAVQTTAGTLEGDRTKHTTKVSELESLHGVHFTVNCELGTARPAAWRISDTIVEPPKPDEFLEGIATELRGDARVQTAAGRLRTYHDAAREDYAARLAALDTLAQPATYTAVAVRGDWDTSSQITGQRRPPGFHGVDNALSSVEANADDTAGGHAARAQSLGQVTRFLDDVIQARRFDAFKGVARALKQRAEAASREATIMGALRTMEALAAPRKAALQLESASREVTLTAPNADGFEAALLEVLPSMYGIYKAADAIVARDLDPIATVMGITNPVIAAI